MENGCISGTLLSLALVLILCALCWFSGWINGSGYQPLEKWEKKTDEGLLFCKLGDNYVWLNKDEYIRLFLEDQGE